LISNDYTHTKDCPDRKAAAADRKAHDALVRTREQRLQHEVESQPSSAAA
jgi:hypothetical protein